MPVGDRMALIELLADGGFHSGESLARRLGVTRAAVWKQLKTVEGEVGLTVAAVPGRGYRLDRPIELLHEERIRRYLSRTAAASLAGVEVHAVLPSTNTRAAGVPLTVGRSAAVLCELQTEGRGRRGRTWISGFADSVTMSVAHRFAAPLSALAGISLVSGVAIARTLTELGVLGLGLKWPNDVVVAGKKLAGILVEASGEIEGPSLAVIGVGLNWRAAPGSGERIDQPWCDLHAIGLEASRNEVAGRLLSALLDACGDYARDGLGAYLEQWRDYDLLIDQSVCVSGAEGAVVGRYLGLDASGAMILDGPRGRQVFAAGEVSLRPAVGS